MQEIELCPIANHAIVFFNREKGAIVTEILSRLNAIEIQNKELLLKYATFKKYAQSDDTEIRTTGWHFQEGFYDLFAPGDDLECYTFTGPFGIKIDITNYTFNFHSYVLNYKDWIMIDPETEPDLFEKRNVVRIYFYQILKALGGDQILYLGCYVGYDEEGDEEEEEEEYEGECEEFFHTEFLDLDSLTEIKIKMRDKLGPPAKSFEEAALNFNRSYYIDYFKDLVID